MSSSNKRKESVQDQFEIALKEMTAVRQAQNWFPVKKPTNGGTLGMNALHGSVSIKGVKLWRSYACHRDLLTFVDSLAYWSCYGYRTSEEVGRHYLDWLVNRSPWSKTGIVPTRLTQDQMFEQGFCWSEMDKVPANLLHNFLVATRSAAEWPALIENWHLLTSKHGLDESLSYFFLTMLHASWTTQHSWFTPGVESRLSRIDQYDWPLDTGQADENYLKNFLGAKTVGLSKVMFFPSAQTRPVNNIWGKPVGFTSKESYTSFLLEKYLNPKFTVKRTGRSTLGDSGLRGITTEMRRLDDNVFVPETIVKVIKAEQDRLGL